VYYLLASGDLYKRKLVRIAGPSLSQQKITVRILEEIDQQIERFLLARIAISVIVGVMIWVGFRMLGLREAGIWALVAAVLFAIPYAGPTMIIIGAAVAGFVQFGSFSMAAAAGGLTLTLAAIEGNVLTLRGVNYSCRLATTISAGERSAKECRPPPGDARLLSSAGRWP
jgi:predicted PurR-regulated permease PerM